MEPSDKGTRMIGSLQDPESSGMMEERSTEGLRKEIGITGLAANVINSIVGGGIFVLPAIVSGKIGSAAIIAYLLCGIMVILITLCFAEVGSRFTISGGAYAYVEKAFGPFPGFLTNSLFWFGFGVLSDAAIASAMMGMIAYAIPLFQPAGIKALVLILVYAGFTYVNIRGVRQGMNMVKINTIMKLLPLLLLIMVGWEGVEQDNLRVTSVPSMKEIGEVTLLLFFAFAGGEIALNNSGEIVNPGRTVPLGLFLGIGTVVVLFVSIQIVAQGVLGPALASQTDAPLAAVAQSLIGHPGKILLITGAVVSIFGALSGGVLSYPRLLFAGARAGMLPSFLGHIHPKFATPSYAISLYSFLVVLFAVSGGFRQLVIISSASLLLIYLGVILATIRLRRIPDPLNTKSFRIPGGLSVPLITLLIVIWILFHLTGREVLGVAVILAILTALFFGMKKISRNHRKNSKHITT